ncbi:MAG TPA: protease pro-enzyme activation domain-containing protein [Candidatus Baltobacteraceae bacterium]|nr:protease pro-enzyme activation domain-containing protein [Candidatus Baltobacteraceae bacterium]
MTVSACGGQSSSSLPNLGPSGTANSPDSTRTASSVPSTPMISVPHTTGALAFSDLGRRSANSPVRVAITLRYNHQAQLDQLVQNIYNRNSGMYHHFLTPDQFNSYYGPTAQQEQSVVSALQAAGFTITKRYSNRTIVDAVAPSSTVERFFSTEMHSVSQGKYGQRYTNVKPAVVPSAISPYILTASLSNVVIARTGVDQAGGIVRNPHNLVITKSRPHHKGNAREAAAAMRVVAAGCTGQLLLNPGFESGDVDWSDPNGDIYDYYPYAYQGNYFTWIDGYSSPYTDPGVTQTVNIPAGCTATLSYYLFVGSNEPATPTDYFYVTVNGHTVQSFNNTTNTGGGYVKKSVNISAYAGQSAKIQFYGVQNGYNTTNFFLDSTALTLSGGSTPTPSPSPTPTHTPTPTPTPTHTPTPTPTPTHTPTPSPTPTHTPTPTPPPTPTPSPTSTPSGGCNGAAADNGPLSNSSGTLATGVAKPFDFPVQHGCNGAGYTAAVIIDDPVNTSYVNTYLSAAGVTHIGTITNEAVDGGGSGDDAETDLDVQTISGLAPGANIIVYDMGSLADQNIEDAYNQALTDGKAVSVNSSFGGCESQDPSFESATNSIAQQGASEGVEFSASSGDSGSNECSGLGVSAPAGDPYMTSIGGINFTYNSSGVLTSVTEGSASGDSGGGGVSTIVPLPSWQSGITGMITSGRNQPDISLPFFPVAVYTGGAWGEYLGTSWSSPASVALFTEADQLHGSKLGWLNQTIYSLFSSTGYNSYFTPCTSGSNGAYSCNASQYNQAAGIGAPKGWALANAL